MNRTVWVAAICTGILYVAVCVAAGAWLGDLLREGPP